MKEKGYKNITMSSIELVYEVPPPGKNADFIYPAYVFKGVMHTAFGDDIGFYTSVPAAG